MKKIISFILIASALLTSLFALTSCFHECEFTGDWTADASSHWHACPDADCTEIADKADHTWDSGKITTKATQEADGVKTYTCTVCQHTKTEAVTFVGLDAEDWAAAFSKDTFENFSYTEEAVIKMTGVELTTVATYKFTADKAYVSVTVTGETSEDTLTGEEARTTREAMVESLQDMLQYGDFEYDPENKVYNLTGDMNIESLGTEAKSATLKFKDGKPAELVYTCDLEVSGVQMDCVATVTFSDFGTTEIE